MLDRVYQSVFHLLYSARGHGTPCGEGEDGRAVLDGFEPPRPADVDAGMASNELAARHHVSRA